MQRFPPGRNLWLAVQNGEISKGSWLWGETITMVTKATTLSGLAATRRRSEHGFFASLTIAISLLVFVGFSRTYYFHTFFGTPKLTIFLHVHAAVMTGWIVWFAVQTFLISSNHTRIHRVLGAFGAGYAVLVILMGCTATVLAARREVRAHSESGSSVLTVLALELTQMALFTCFVAFGVWLRNLTDYHKRLMLLATFCMLPNPIVRLFIWAGLGSNILILSLWALLVTAVVMLDSIRNRKLHPAFGFGATIIVGFLYLVYFCSRTSLWQHFAANIVG